MEAQQESKTSKNNIFFLMFTNFVFLYYIQSFRRLSYSRHAVNDRDLSSSHHLNHNMHMHIRRMVSETVRRQHSKRVKRNRVSDMVIGALTLTAQLPTSRQKKK